MNGNALEGMKAISLLPPQTFVQCTTSAELQLDGHSIVLYFPLAD
jgi:hypothetical protein